MTASCYEAQLCYAAGPFRTDAGGSAGKVGRAGRLLHGRARRSLAPEARERLRQRELQVALYSHFYCSGAEPLPQPCPELPLPVRHHLVEALAQANGGRGSWQDRWTLIDRDGGEAVRRDGLELRADGVEWRSSDRALPEEVEIRVPRHLPNAWPGFYLALSETPIHTAEWQRTVRVYWNVTGKGAPILMRLVTEALNGAGVPFRFKVLIDLACFRRCDAAVLYLRAGDLAQALPLVAAIHARMDGEILPRVPALTLKLAPGLALAESPPHGQSFGLHRCALLAEALLQPESGRTSSVRKRVERMSAHLHANGIDPGRPYRAIGSDFPDEVAFLRSGASARAASVSGARDTATTPSACLATADAIGGWLVTTAFRADGRCNWIAPGPASEFASLNGDLYSGTGGIAWFLAELSLLTGRHEQREAAIGAARQALDWAGSGAAAAGGLYSGALAATLAAAHVGVRLDDHETVEQARRLAEVGSPAEPGPDLVSGTAGTIVALLALAEMLGEPRLIDRAASAAERLLAQARRDRHGACWPGREGGAAQDLLGYARGAAGIAHALLEAYDYTGDPRLRAAALDAFAFEDAWFDPKRRNWPVLAKTGRGQPAPARIARRNARMGWAHGAPGAALARIRGNEILKHAELADSARAALASTCAHILAAEDVRLDVLSICDGLAGAGAALLEGDAAMPDPDPAWRRTAEQLAGAAMTVYGSPEDWLCANGVASAPGLMGGLSGIGQFYLQLAEGRVCSPFLMRPRRWRSTP